MTLVPELSIQKGLDRIGALCIVGARVTVHRMWADGVIDNEDSNDVMIADCLAKFSPPIP